MTEFDDELDGSAELVPVQGPAGPVDIHGLA